MNLVTTPLRFLSERLRSREDSEHEQAILRIILALLIHAWLRLLAKPGEPADPPVMLGLDAYLALATLLLAAILIWPVPNVPRRMVGMVADVGVITWALFLSGEIGVSWFGIYLFITFGNGFRYGRAYLFT